MDMVGHESVTIELYAWPVKLCFGQDAGAEFTNTFLWSKDELSSKCFGDDMVGDRWVYIASVAYLRTW